MQGDEARSCSSLLATRNSRLTTSLQLYRICRRYLLHELFDPATPRAPPRLAGFVRLGAEPTGRSHAGRSRDSQGGFSMKQCIALAGLLCLLASGCAHTAGCGDRCGVAANRRAPLITRSAARPIGKLFGKDTGNCELAGCDVDCGERCGGCDGCANGGPCSRLAERIAGGGCGPGGCGIAGCGADGLCPHGGGYPEYPAFNQGPPTGQVAYPYYTTRGPRDFLLNNPPTIGPN